MAIILNSERDWATKKNKDEWLIRSSSELDDLPDTVGPGSVAYTADLSFMAIMDEDGTWQEIGGD